MTPADQRPEWTESLAGKTLRAAARFSAGCSQQFDTQKPGTSSQVRMEGVSTRLHKLGPGRSQSACVATNGEDGYVIGTDSIFAGPSAHLSATGGVSWWSAEPEDMVGESVYIRVSGSNLWGITGGLAVAPAEDGLLGLPLNVRIDFRQGLTANAGPGGPVSFGVGNSRTMFETVGSVFNYVF